MKKIFLLLIFILFFTSFTSSTLVEIHSSNNQEIHVTPIKTTSKFEKLEETKILTTNEKGISIIDFDLNEPFYLEVKLNNLKNTTKIFEAEVVP